MKKILNDFCPPIIKKTINLLLKRNVQWIGNFQTWQEAEKLCRGYDPDIFLSRLIESTKISRDDETKAERDSLIFDKTTYPYPLLTNLFAICSSLQTKSLFVLDFGGSLGTLYFHNQKFLKMLPSLTWNILEQDKNIQAGKTYFETQELLFHSNLNEAKAHIKENDTKILILSSVLQYLEAPYTTLKWLIDEIGPHAILIDRTPFTRSYNHRITIQKVPKHIYDTSCACHLFSKTQFLDFFSNFHSDGGGGYNLLDTFGSYTDIDQEDFQFLGFSLILKDSPKKSGSLS